MQPVLVRRLRSGLCDLYGKQSAQLEKEDAFHKLPYVLVSYVGILRVTHERRRILSSAVFRGFRGAGSGRWIQADLKCRLAFSIQSWTCRRAVREFEMCDIARVGLGAALVLLAGLNPDDIS